MSDFSLKDQQWFARPGQIFNARSLSVDTPPLTVSSPVTPNDLISAEGACPGMPSDANALSDAGQPAGAPAPSSAVALGHTECDVARAIGPPDNVSLSNNARGDRVAVITYMRGNRPGQYTFTAGRLSSVEAVAVPEPVKPSKPAKSKKRATG